MVRFLQGFQKWLREVLHRMKSGTKQPSRIVIKKNTLLSASIDLTCPLMFALGSTFQVIIQVCCATSEEPTVGIRSPERIDEKLGSFFINWLWKLSCWGASTEALSLDGDHLNYLALTVDLAPLSGLLSSRKSRMRGRNENIFCISVCGRETASACKLELN